MGNDGSSKDLKCEETCQEKAARKKTEKNFKEKKERRELWAKRIFLGVLVLALLVSLVYLLWHALVSSSQPQPPAYWDGIRLWMIVTLIAFCLANVLFFIVQDSFANIYADAAMVFSTFWAVSAATVMILTIFYIYPDKLRESHAFLALIGGCVVGWGLGMYVSPQDSSEQSEFAKIGTALAGLASGYTLKGFQAWIFKTENEHYHIYFVLAGISAVLTAATIYNVRAYGRNSVRISFDHADPSAANAVAAKTVDSVSFRAAVSGPDDTSVRWSIIPDPKDEKQAAVEKACKHIAEMTTDGKFRWNGTDLSTGGKCKVRAESSANPKLIDVVDVTVTA